MQYKVWDAIVGVVLLGVSAWTMVRGSAWATGIGLVGSA